MDYLNFFRNHKNPSQNTVLVGTLFKKIFTDFSLLPQTIIMYTPLYAEMIGWQFITPSNTYCINVLNNHAYFLTHCGLF